MPRKPRPGQRPSKRSRRTPAAKFSATLKKLRAAISRWWNQDQPIWQRVWAWVWPQDPKSKWPTVTSLSATAYNFVVKVPWVIAIAVIVIIVVQGLTQSTTVIEPISVPKDLSDSGYTAEVAARRLRDAIQKYSADASSSMKGPAIAMHGELPTVVVPTVGISLDAIVTSVRTVLHSTRSRTISGEITKKGDLLYLQLRLDGRTIEPLAGDDDKNIDRKNPDALLANAVGSIMDKIQPYTVAAALHNNHNDLGAFKKIEEIINRFQDTDDLNVAWAYNLKGILYYSSQDPDDVKFPNAIAAFKTALEFDWNLAAAHVNFGIVYERQNEMDKAIAEFRLATRVDDTNAKAFYILGSTLTDPKQKKERDKVLHKAALLDAKYAQLASTDTSSVKNGGQARPAGAVPAEVTDTPGMQQ
jgi:hypothetical protein